MLQQRRSTARGRILTTSKLRFSPLVPRTTHLSPHTPHHPCSYASMAGMKKSYLYIGLGEGVVGMRTFACWCHACMRAIGRGQGSLDSNLHCADCVSPQLKWLERSCARTDAAGLANARSKAQGHARKLASQLKHSLESGPVLIAVQNRGEDDEDQYISARSPSHPFPSPPLPSHPIPSHPTHI